MISRLFPPFRLIVRCGAAGPRRNHQNNIPKRTSAPFHYWVIQMLTTEGNTLISISAHFHPRFFFWSFSSTTYPQINNYFHLSSTIASISTCFTINKLLLHLQTTPSWLDVSNYHHPFYLLSRVWFLSMLWWSPRVVRDFIITSQRVWASTPPQHHGQPSLATHSITPTVSLQNK